MSISPIFAGVSSFANDLQSVITRAVGIASLPLTQLQNQRQDMSAQSSALSGLNANFTALQTALQGLGDALGPSSYSATSTDPAAVSASVSASALQGSYTIDVGDVGSASTSMSGASLPTVADPYSTSISSSTDFTLTVDGKTTDVKPGDGSLVGLAQAINSASAGVQATLVNIGNSTSPQYRLVLRGSNLGPVSIQLNDGSQDLLDTLSTGTVASYTVNGLPTAIQSNSRTVTLAPGVSIDLLRQTTPGQPVTVTVSRTTTGISSAISAFVDAYNSAVDSLDQQVGKTAGVLSGHSIVGTLHESLRSITAYSVTSGPVKSLAGMGVQLDRFGKLSFEASQFSSSGIDALQTFLGSATGSGFLKTANDALTSVEDPVSGSLSSAMDLVSKEITHQDDLIATNQQRVNDLQTSLQQQMAAADALIASLEQQRNFITNLFTAMMNSNLNGTGVKSN